MIAGASHCVYEQPAVRDVTGDTIRPGGLTLTDRALALCPLPTGARVLDVGCGPGATVEHLRAAHHFDAFGLDASALLLQSGRCRNAALSVIQAAGERLPIADKRLDAIFAECSLSVMADADRVLEEFGRTLKGDGILVLSDVYARNPNGVSALRHLPLDACLRGAMSRQQVADKLHAHGFHVVVWEDHSEALKHLAAQLIMACGSMQQFWQRVTPAGEAVDTRQAIRQAKPGYYLSIARKI